MEATLTLQELSERTGASVRSIRYYVEQGWLPKPQRAPANGVGRPPVIVSEEAVDRVRLIQARLKGQASGVTMPSLNLYKYQVGDEVVIEDVINVQTDADWVLLELRNGDIVLRKRRKE